MYNLGILLGAQTRNPAVQTSSANMYQRIGNASSRKYMHVIFRPVAPPLLKDASKQLRMPASLEAFLAEQNGGRLFEDSVCLFGVVPRGRHLPECAMDRVPVSIEAQNARSGITADMDWVQIGAYREGKARVLVNRSDNRVRVAESSGARVIGEWPDLCQWLERELATFSKKKKGASKAKRPRNARSR